MAISASSSAAVAVVGAKNLIAKSPTFQTYVELYHEDGAANETNAKTHIFADELFDPDETQRDVRPFVMVTLDQQNYSSLAQCSVRRLDTDGGVLVGFFDNARFTNIDGDPPTDDHDDSYINFLNFVFDTIDDFSIEGLLGDGTNYDFESIEVIQPPIRSEIAQRVTDDYWSCYLLLGFDHVKG